MTNQVNLNGIPAIENIQQEDANRKKSSSFQITRVITKVTDENETDSPGYDNDDDEDGESDSELSDKDETDYKMSAYHENGNIVSFPLVNQTETVQTMPPAPLVNSINIPRPNIPSQFHTVNQQFPTHNNQFHGNGVQSHVSQQISSNNIHSNIPILNATQTQQIQHQNIVHQSQHQQQLQQPQQQQQQQQNHLITNGNNNQPQVPVVGVSQSDTSLIVNSIDSQLATKSNIADTSKSAHNFAKVKPPVTKEPSKPVHLCEPSRFKVVKVRDKN